MTTSANTNSIEMHGCIVCAKVFEVLAVYAPDGSLVGCTLNSPGGRIVPDEHRPLVACERHSTRQVETSYLIWKSRNGEGPDKELEEDE
jgi:hypothetical protein